MYIVKSCAGLHPEGQRLAVYRTAVLPFFYFVTLSFDPRSSQSNRSTWLDSPTKHRRMAHERTGIPADPAAAGPRGTTAPGSGSIAGGIEARPSLTSLARIREVNLRKGRVLR
jgi:hypothetical protein